MKIITVKNKHHKKKHLINPSNNEPNLKKKFFPLFDNKAFVLCARSPGKKFT